LDISKLSQGEKIAAGSAIILAVVMFVFPWFELGNGIAGALSSIGVDTTYNAWQSFGFINVVLLVTIVLAVGAAVVKATEMHIDFPLSTIVTMLGALSTILVLFRILDPPSEAARKYGVFLGVIFAAALTYGGWLSMQSEGTSFQDAADRLGGGDDVGGGPGGGEPPRGGAPPSI
jgi:hypothetical protein